MTSTATGFTPDMIDLQTIVDYTGDGTGQASPLYQLAKKMSQTNFAEGFDRAEAMYIANSRMSTKFIMNKLMEKAK